MARKLYLAVFAALVVLLTLGGLYLRHRANKAAPATPPPNLPGFKLEAGCGADPAKPAGKAQTR